MIRAKEYEGSTINLPIYSSTSALIKGQGLIWGVDGGGDSTCALITADETAADIFAVLMEAPTTQTTNCNTPVVYQAPVQLVQPVHIWKVYWDMDTDLDTTSSSSTVVTHATSDDNLDGSWIYINSGTGRGQLRYISGAGTTTKTVSDAFSTTPDATSDFVLIRNVGFPTDGVSLNSTRDKFVSVLNESSANTVIILKNFMEGKFGSVELCPTKNSQLRGANNLHLGSGVKFYSLAIFIDTKISITG